MPREPEPSLNERAFILEALREGVRLDGRALDTFRDIEISFGEEGYGVADVTLGKTRYHLRFNAARSVQPTKNLQQSSCAHERGCHRSLSRP